MSEPEIKIWVGETSPYNAASLVDGRANNTTALINVSQPISVTMTSLIDGEKQVLAHYDRAINASAPDNAEYPVLVKQREALRAKVADMRAGKPT